MHIVVLFYNIGSYHLARLQAAYEQFSILDWKLTAIQLTDSTDEHPWGDISTPCFPIRTLLPRHEMSDNVDISFESRVAAEAITDLLESVQPDVLAIPGWGFPISRAALAFAQKYKIPTVLMSESKHDDEQRTWWKEKLKSWLYVKKFSSALVGGPAHRDYLVNLGFQQHRIFEGYDVVDNHYFSQQSIISRSDSVLARKRQPKIPRKPYFLAVTRLIPRKNIIRLVEAFANYCNIVGIQQAWHLVICGSGVEESDIRQLIDKYQLNSLVHLPGFLTYQQIGSWYGLANAFVHPALIEQWGLVINEACAAGLPILCSQTVGACHSLVKNGENGFVFDPQETSAIAQALLKIHSMNEVACLNMGAASQQIVAEFSPEKFGGNLLNAVKTALAVHSQPTSR